ncbi:hypothetical protein Peur_002603 [Populus x canadensis]
MLATISTFSSFFAPSGEGKFTPIYKCRTPTTQVIGVFDSSQDPLLLANIPNVKLGWPFGDMNFELYPRHFAAVDLPVEKMVYFKRFVVLMDLIFSMDRSLWSR